jgi:hypothetical protein
MQGLPQDAHPLDCLLLRLLEVTPTVFLNQLGRMREFFIKPGSIPMVSPHRDFGNLTDMFEWELESSEFVFRLQRPDDTRGIDPFSYHATLPRTPVLDVLIHRRHTGSTFLSRFWHRSTEPRATNVT